MSNVNRTYTEKLEKVISTGVDLRHQMRIKTENKDVIINAQKEEIEKLKRQISLISDENKLKLKLAKAVKTTEKKEKQKYKNLVVVREEQEQYTKRLKQWIHEHNGGQLPEVLRK